MSSQVDPERHRQLAREFYWRHRERLNAEKTARRKADPERFAVYDRRAYAKRRVRKAATGKAWRERNREHVRDLQRRWHLEHPTYERDRARRRRLKDPEKFRAYMRAYARAHPDEWRALVQTRRARLAGVEGHWTSAEWRAKLAEYEGRCAYCGALGKMTVDHVVPISRNGTNWIANIVPACLPCNVSKFTRSAAEFMVRRRTP
jgi:5-methylcytosine-specific restriction endonuclease McrA